MPLVLTSANLLNFLPVDTLNFCSHLSVRSVHPLAYILWPEKAKKLGTREALQDSIFLNSVYQTVFMKL